MPAPIPEDRDDAYLLDMLTAAKLIRRYMRKVSFQKFDGDCEKRDAVALRLAIIGEAATHVSPATQKTLPTIPFKKIRALRNRISHDYDSVNFRLVWEITQNEIAPLIAVLEEYLH